MLWAPERAEKRRNATERIARTLYQRRVQLNKPGDQQSDWTEAEKIVRRPLRRTLFALNLPFAKLQKPTSKAFQLIAWDTPRWFLFSLPHLEWVKLLAVPLVIAAAGSIITGQIQREANQNAVLKAYFDKLEELTFEQKLLAEKPNEGAIVLARGRTVAALRELDLSRRTQLIDFLQASNLSLINETEAEAIISFKEQNLTFINLSYINLNKFDFQNATLHSAILSSADLSEANLSNANLSNANLTSANLSNAQINNANLSGAQMNNAKLGTTAMRNADLTGANLFEADLSNAYLFAANLSKAYLSNANLGDANLFAANLSDAIVHDADLSGAYMSSAILTGAILTGADLSDAILSNAENWTDKQLAQALLCNTILPEGSNLDPNRDCPK